MDTLYNSHAITILDLHRLLIAAHYLRWHFFVSAYTYTAQTLLGPVLLLLTCEPCCCLCFFVQCQAHITPREPSCTKLRTTWAKLQQNPRNIVNLVYQATNESPGNFSADQSKLLNFPQTNWLHISTLLLEVNQPVYFIFFHTYDFRVECKENNWRRVISSAHTVLGSTLLIYICMLLQIVHNCTIQLNTR